MSELLLTYRGAVYPWHCDHVGHMNVMWYVGKFDEATWNLFSMAGITPAYLREQHRGMAAVQQNIAYKRELKAGDVLLVRSGVLEVREKLIRFCHEMRNAVTDEVSAITVVTGVHMDTDARKACPLPEELATRARTLITSYAPPEELLSSARTGTKPQR